VLLAPSAAYVASSLGAFSPDAVTAARLLSRLPGAYLKPDTLLFGVYPVTPVPTYVVDSVTAGSVVSKELDQLPPATAGAAVADGATTADTDTARAATARAAREREGRAAARTGQGARCITAPVLGRSVVSWDCATALPPGGE